MKQRRLIVNADDFGMSKGVTDGIIEAHLNGVVTSTSFMVNMPGSEYAAALVPSVPNLCIGVHLNLSQGRPILPPDRVPTLVDENGSFYPYAEAIRKLTRWEFSTAEIEAEFRAQISWLKDHGITPSHGDSHHHMHLYPCSIGAYRAALSGENISHSRAPRHWSYPTAIGGPHGGGTLRRITVSAYMEYLQTISLRNFTLPTSCVTAHPEFQRSWKRIAEGWSQSLKNLPWGDFELGCHPGFAEDAFSDSDELADRRQLEVRFLTSHEIKDVISQREIQLIRYADLNENKN